MEKQTIRIHRVGSVTFGFVLIAMGIIFLMQQFLPGIDYVLVFRFWPVILIGLGIEALLGCTRKNIEVLDEKGKVIEQSKVVYDVTAILLTLFLTGFSVVLALMNWSLQYAHDVHISL